MRIFPSTLRGNGKFGYNGGNFLKAFSELHMLALRTCVAIADGRLLEESVELEHLVIVWLGLQLLHFVSGCVESL